MAAVPLVLLAAGLLFLGAGMPAVSGHLDGRRWPYGLALGMLVGGFVLLTAMVERFDEYQQPSETRVWEIVGTGGRRLVVGTLVLTGLAAGVQVVALAGGRRRCTAVRRMGMSIAGAAMLLQFTAMVIVAVSSSH